MSALSQIVLDVMAVIRGLTTGSKKPKPLAPPITPEDLRPKTYEEICREEGVKPPEKKP